MALEIGAPEYLLHKFLGGGEAETVQRGGQHVLFRDETKAYPGRQHGDVLTKPLAFVGIAEGGVVAACARGKVREAGKPCRTGGFKCKRDHVHDMIPYVLCAVTDYSAAMRGRSASDAASAASS